MSRPASLSNWIVAMLLVITLALVSIAVLGLQNGRSVESASVVMVGAGDIAGCAFNNDAATAKLLDGISGTVFTTGDNAYKSGTTSEFENCYAPTWGRHKARTMPSVSR